MIPLTRSIIRNIFPNGRFTSSLTSSLSFSTSSQEEEVSFESLKPSRNFEKSLPKPLKANYEKALKEFEIFVYMGKYVPNKMTDEDWKQSVKCETLNERLGYWEFLAIKERRQQRKDNINNSKHDNYKKILAEQQSIYESGGMGYGPEMYQLISNPMRNQKRVNNWEGTKVFASMQTESPRIALDVQYIQEMSRRDLSELGNQMQYVISENFNAKNPLVMDFVNSPSQDFLNQWLEKSVGYYTGSYTSQTILPDFSTKGIKELYGNPKDVIYISPNARDVLDGPLVADVIGICVTMGRKREALSAARRANIRAYRLPIHRYVKWKSGPQVIPFPNILNILREVYANNGDWSRALHNNISRRHLIGNDEDEQKRLQSLRRKTREEERRELTQAILSATQD